jgi:hypothetical protein
VFITRHNNVSRPVTPHESVLAEVIRYTGTVRQRWVRETDRALVGLSVELSKRKPLDSPVPAPTPQTFAQVITMTDEVRARALGIKLD